MLSMMRKRAQSWIIKVLLFSVAIVFVFWGVGSFRSERASQVAKVNGKTISVNEYQHAYQQTLDRIKDVYGQSLDEKTMYSPEFKRRVLDGLIDKQLILEMGKKLGFSVTSEELSRTIQQMPFFQENGKFSPFKYKRMLQMKRMTPEAFEDEQKTALLMERVDAFLNGFVKIEPEEIRLFYSFLNDEVNAYFLPFKKEDYKNRIAVTQEQLKAYFNQTLSRYRTPVQVRMTYLDTNPKDFESKVSVSDKEVQEYYQQNQQKFIDTKTSKPLPAEQVQDKIRTVLKSDKTRELARQKVEEVYDQVLTKGNLKVFGREFKVPIKETEWMTYGETRSGIEGVKEFNQKAFSLKKGELAPIVDLGDEWGFVILQVSDRKESQLMTLSQAESRVKEDFINEKSAQTALSEAEAFIKELRQKKDIQVIARERSRKVEETSFFSRAKNHPSWADTPEVQEALFSIGPSNPIIEKPFKLGADYGIVVFKETRPASMEDFKKDEERFSQALQQQKKKAVFEQWSRFLRDKGKVSINQDLL
jgi:peptidyl-prolyl cis-trans isomerase D